MSKSSEISYIKSAERLATTKYPKHTEIHAVYESSIKGLNDLLRGMFDGVDDSLFELANNARTNNEQNRFFEAMRDVRIKRKRIEANFSQAIQALFEPKSVLSNSTTPNVNHIQDADKLSLVGENDMEEEVAISSMATKAQANFQGSLLQFHARIASLYGAKDIQETSHPLEPIKICRAFASSCASLELEIKERLLIYKQFDRYVMAKLESVIETSNDSLISQGVMPNLKHSNAHSQSIPSRQTSNSHSEALASNQQQEDIFPVLQELLKQMRTANSRTYQTTNQQGSETAPDLLALLTAIQKKADNNTEDFARRNALNVRTAVLHEIQQLNHASHIASALKPVDEDLINLVSMLFDFILEDYNLSPPIQVLISRLQIPILKLVIRDKSFFSSSKHPARHLLNSLAKAGIACSDNQEKSKDALYNKIYQIVHRVLNEFDGNIELFVELQNEFNTFLSREEHKTSIVEQRTREAEAGRIRTQQAQKRVEHALSQLILSAHHAIPSIVIDTLKNGWSRVMFLAYLKDEQEHQWQRTVDIAHNLIWCLQPLKKPKDRQRWITIVPKLLKELDVGLRNVSYNTANLDNTLNELKQALTSSFKESSYAHTNSKITRSKKTTSSTAIEKHATNQSEQNEATQLNDQLNQVSQLKEGQWVEFRLMNGSKYRCKLSAKLTEADCYIFVNRAGLKPIEKSRLELAKDLKNERVVFLEQGLIIDRAMNSIMSNLRQKSKN